MVKYYINEQGTKKITEAETLPERDCWIHMEGPTKEEIAQVAELTGIDNEALMSAMDIDETAHLVIDEKLRKIIVDIPKTIGDEISTMPLGIIQNDKFIITVCMMQTSVLDTFFVGKIKNVDISNQSLLAYRIMLNNCVRYLYYLRQIDRNSDNIQKDLLKFMRNKELLQLLDLQKSLVFFSASLTANFAVVQKLNSSANLGKATAEERDILEDIALENKQALEMCSIYREIIKNTTEGFASVINNNQNFIMKFLTAITIVLTIPMVFASYWGMNTGVPFETRLWGFWVIVGISALITTIVAIIMIKKKMFKLK